MVYGILCPREDKFDCGMFADELKEQLKITLTGEGVIRWVFFDFTGRLLEVVAALVFTPYAAGTLTVDIGYCRG